MSFKRMLVVSAELENIAFLELRPVGNVISYCFNLKCEACGWVSERKACIYMDCQADPLRQPKRSFGTRVKCEECKLEGHIYLVPGHGHHLEQNHCNDVPLMLFECDGIVPVQYYFESGWSAITTSGRRINNIDLICQGYEDEIDGERIAIIVEAKFLPYSGR